MNNIAVIFDTNACRDICRSRLVANPATEWSRYDAALKSRNIVCFANPYVLMELMAHLADSTDPAFAECRHSLIALYNLAAVNQHQIRILSDSESLLLRTLYHTSLTESDQTTQRLCTLALHVVQNTPGTFAAQAIAGFREIRSHLQVVEQGFVADMWQYVVQGLNPSSTGWAPLENDDSLRTTVLNILRSQTMPQTIALAFVSKAMLQANMQESTTELHSKATFVRTTFPTSIRLYLEILKRIVETGCNVNRPQRANWIWDIQIAMGVGQQIETVNKHLHLVTTDGDIVAAADAAGCRPYVHTLQEFRTAIGI